ncbi:transcriptional regulator, LacI family [Aliiruegeria lutimaris]|uniref:Transcriptional regulator, LacI family n=2 Tax=Aliiruegeria lutimaris TaxID=571298 RepID=A0A1G9F2M1_9RHOB|nr:transcriptional regulator, LacI family [Aliiruegeria lutimaris]
MKSKDRLPDKKSKVTVREVALLAQVSETTVSRIMRKEGSVANETRERVMNAVRELGYVPNRLAGSLASLNTNLVGVLVPSLQNIVFPEVLRGIQAGLSGSHMQAVTSVTDYDFATEESMVRGLLAWNPAAVLVTGLNHNEATSRMLRQSSGRVVEMMEVDSEPIDVAVGMFHRSAGYETARYLLQKGYRHFGYVAHDIGPDRRARLRHEGMAQALSEAGLGFIAESRAETPSSIGIGKVMTARLLERAPDVKVAIYSNDDMAVGGVFHCMEAGLSIGSDLSIFGFNGLEIGRHLPQPLSTMRSNRFLIGKTAIEQILQSPERPAEPVRIDTGFEIVEGATA